MTKKYPWPNTLEMIAPSMMKKMNMTTISANDFSLLLRIWSWNDRRSGIFCKRNKCFNSLCLRIQISKN